MTGDTSVRCGWSHQGVIAGYLLSVEVDLVEKDLAPAKSHVLDSVVCIHELAGAIAQRVIEMTQTLMFQLAATTLPGLRGRRRIVGALIEKSYPLGPRLGCPLNISAFGNDDRLDMGIALDPAAITDPESLRECLTVAFGAFEPSSGS